MPNGTHTFAYLDQTFGLRKLQSLATTQLLFRQQHVAFLVQNEPDVKPKNSAESENTPRESAYTQQAIESWHAIVSSSLQQKITKQHAPQHTTTCACLDTISDAVLGHSTIVPPFHSCAFVSVQGRERHPMAMTSVFSGGSQVLVQRTTSGMPLQEAVSSR